MKGYKLIGLANNPRAKMSHRLRAMMKRRERLGKVAGFKCATDKRGEVAK